MSHGYDLDPSDLDEFLVEYVDGTMDPVVREAFEEFLRVYPEVAAHVDCLASVRTELCRLGDDCRCQAPPGFQARLKRQLACEMTGALSLEQWTPQLNMIALAFSITILMLAAGLSQVGSEDLADAAPVEPEKVLLETLETLETSPFALAEEESQWKLSHVHQVSMASSFSAAFDRPMLMSVRHDFVAMKPVAVPMAP